MAYLGERDVTLVRRNGGQWGDDGRWVLGTPASTTIRASVQQPTYRQIQTLPDGDRTMDPILVLTATELRTAVEGSTEADAITVDGVTYVVRQSLVRRSLIPGCTALCVRQQPLRPPAGTVAAP